MEILSTELFDIIQAQAQASSRRRMHYDLRTVASLQRSGIEPSIWHDQSQRMLNVMMADTVIPIHRHNETNEVVIVLRGSGYEAIYDSTGKEMERVHIAAGSPNTGVVVPKGAWHTFIAEVDGTTIFEAKDRPYDPSTTEEYLNIQ